MIDSGLPKRTVSEEDLERLKKQRETNDGRYDEALTRLDAALFSVPDLPHPPPAPDETQVTPINARWDILRARPAVGGLRGRLARFVWRLVQPVFAEQQAFNSLLVDHLNRNIAPQRETVKSIESTVAMIGGQLQQLVAFHSTLLQYLQRITPFVNSKDYEFYALARRVYEDAEDEIQSLARTQRALSAAIQGLSDELLKQVESLKSHVQRYDGRIEGATAAVAVVQQQAAALQREVSRRLADGGAGEARGAGEAGGAGRAGRAGSEEHVARSGGSANSTLAGDAALESWKYPAFEGAFRGTETDIADRLAGYVAVFASARDVLDVGCGRGEFLDLLAARGVPARGIDLNYEMVEICRGRGLDVTHGDALTYLRGLADESHGGLFAAQVVEHLTPDYLLAFLNEAQRVLRRGSPIVLETINVACWYAFFQSYIRDITHARPLHPDTLKYLVTASGFADATVEFRVPVPEADRLQRPPEIVWRPTGEDKDAIATLAKTVDDNAALLNRFLFTSLDYAVIARRA
jgi:O-antigen chain-terminating methyltransferase